MSNDAVHPFVGVDLFLHRDLVGGAGLEATPDTHVETLGVFTKHHEVDVGRRAMLQRAQSRVEQPHRTIVDVEIELEAGAEQDVARVAVVRHARIAECANKDRVERAQQIVAAGGTVSPVAR